MIPRLGCWTYTVYDWLCFIRTEWNMRPVWPRSGFYWLISKCILTLLLNLTRASATPWGKWRRSPVTRWPPGFLGNWVWLRFRKFSIGIISMIQTMGVGFGWGNTMARAVS